MTKFTGRAADKQHLAPDLRPNPARVEDVLLLKGRQMATERVGFSLLDSVDQIMLRDSVAKLGREDRRAWELWVEGRSYREVGAILGVSKQTAWARVRKVGEFLKGGLTK